MFRPVPTEHSRWLTEVGRLAGESVDKDRLKTAENWLWWLIHLAGQRFTSIFTDTNHVILTISLWWTYTIVAWDRPIVCGDACVVDTPFQVQAHYTCAHLWMPWEDMYVLTNHPLLYSSEKVSLIGPGSGLTTSKPQTSHLSSPHNSGVTTVSTRLFTPGFCHDCWGFEHRSSCLHSMHSFSLCQPPVVAFVRWIILS